MGKQGSREEGEGSLTDKEESAILWLAPPRDASSGEGPDTKLVCGSRLEPVMKAAEPSGRGAWPDPTDAAKHWSQSYGISFRAIRGTARPGTGTTRVPLTGHPGNPAPHPFFQPSGLLASSRLRRSLSAVRARTRLRRGGGGVPC